MPPPGHKHLFLLFFLVLLWTLALEAGAEAGRGGRRRNSGRRDNFFDNQEEASVQEEEEEGKLYFDKAKGKNREGKFFSLFSIVQFRNSPCRSTATLTSGNGNRNGTCFTASECGTRSGTAQGNCAAGFGVCCVFVITSATGATINQNCTYVQNPGFPSTSNSNTGISYSVNKCTPSVCSLRLDFEVFTIQGIGGTAQPDEGVCMDTFVVAGTANQNLPTICGENSGQHIYLDATNPCTLTFAFNGGTAFPRQWDIKVTQIECANSNAPPTGCLQYHTTLTGRITTFNFNAMGDNHLNNQMYSICIRPAAGFCCVQYQVCGDVVNPFSLDTNLAMAMQDSLCSTDYIVISNSQATCQQGSNMAVDSRYCGLAFSNNNMVAAGMDTAVCDCTAPFIVDVVTDGFADGKTATGSTMVNTIQQSRGVCLDYTQIPCGSI